MKNSHCFFENKECEYYPCHEGIEEMNCLFCYCPLYGMENCPGSYTLLEKDGAEIKSCMDCPFPHKPENYDKIIAILTHGFSEIKGDAVQKIEK